MKKVNTRPINAVIWTAGLVLALSAGASFAQTNLIVNGSFETGGAGVENFPGWDQIGPAGNNSNYGVAQASAPPDVAEQGSFYAYFHGHPTDGSQDCLGQTLALTVGAQYTISYYLATDGPALGSNAVMWADLGTSFGIDYSKDRQLTAYWPNSSNALPYQKFTTIITATNASEILSFHGVDATSAILLDNVSVTLTPQLNVSVSSTNKLTFTWTAPTNGFHLQTNGSLRTTNWGTLTNQPVTVGSSNQVVLPVPATDLFYRLTLP